MSWIKMAFDDAKEVDIVPEGTYTIVAESLEWKQDKNNNDYLLISHSIEGEENAKPVRHFIFFSKDGDEKEMKNRRLLETIKYLDLLSIPRKKDGFDEDDVPGSSGEVFLEEDEYEGRFSNKIRIVVKA